MASYERLTAQDTTFLHIETATQPQHVGSLGLFEAGPFLDGDGRFRLDDARAVVESRLHLVPKFRKRLMTVPLDQGRPVWVDDERFDLTYHVRLTALPNPGSFAQLKALFARIQSHLLDRRRPLWELWFVENVVDGRVALLQKTHHCLVDGISGVDVATVLLDLDRDTSRTQAPAWTPEPPPSPQRLVTESLLERATEPAEMVRSMRALVRGPRQVLERVGTMAKVVVSGVQGTPPPAPWNVPISPHRRWEEARVALAQVKRIRDVATSSELTADRCSINDVVLAACTGSLRAFLQERDVPVDGLTLKAMVPVSMRSADEQGALGNRVSMVPADLPVHEADPRWRLRYVHENMAALKQSGLAVAGDDLIQMTNYLPPTVLGMASRLLARNLGVNTTITNVPGPQFPLYCMGAKLLEAFPYVGIVDGMGLTIALVSYDGQLGFGITGDRDVLPDLRVIADGIEAAVDELEAALGVQPKVAKGADVDG
jgi:WS/DGAT/MGAT family acyltransferase